MAVLSRRVLLRGAASTAALAGAMLCLPRGAWAAVETVGVLIPGSKSDKGWMESGYDGMVASERKYGDKIKVQMIENINYADMEQALINLAGQQRAGHRRRRPDPGGGPQGRAALSEGQILHRRRQQVRLPVQRRANTT